jgi:hypothetical protein
MKFPLWFALFAFICGCGTSPATTPDGGGAGDGATCEAVCSHAASLCNQSSTGGCPAKCESDLSATQRQCIAAASSCASAVACTSDGPAPGGTSGGTVEDDASTSSTSPSTGPEIAAAWDEFVTDVEATAKAQSKTVVYWSLRITVDGSEVFVRNEVADTAEAKAAVEKLPIRSGAVVSSEFEAYAYDSVTKKNYLWRLRSFR